MQSLKKIFFLMLMAMTCVSVNASADDPPGDPLDFIINPGSNNGGPRQPIAVPIVYLDASTLYFYDNDVEDMVIRLVDVNTEEEVLTDAVYAGTPSFDLPSTLSGDYLLILERGNYAFVAEINL